MTSQKKWVADAVLIDDDEIIHRTWQLVARSKDKTLLSYSSVQRFQNDAELIDQRTPIYIDSYLGEDERGELIARGLFEAGFQKIYLITGHHQNEYPQMDWILDILGKEPPF